MQRLDEWPKECSASVYDTRFVVFFIAIYQNLQNSGIDVMEVKYDRLKLNFRYIILLKRKLEKILQMLIYDIYVIYNI